MRIERPQHFQLEGLQVEFEVPFSLLYFGLKDWLKAVFFVFETDKFEFVWSQLLLNDEDLLSIYYKATLMPWGFEVKSDIRMRNFIL